MLVACKRGSIAPRSKSGHCLCQPCRDFRYKRGLVTKRPGYKKEWVAKNPDKVRQYSRKWIDANKEKRREIERQWRLKNPDKVAAMSYRAGANWSKKNAGRRNALTAKRRAAKRQRTPAWANHSEILAIYIQASSISSDTGIPHEVDHIIPLQGVEVCGLHVQSNLQIVPRAANRSKRNKLCAA